MTVIFQIKKSWILTLNLSLAILGSVCSILGAILVEYTEINLIERDKCTEIGVIIAISVHFFQLSCFCWMSCNGIEYYRRIILVSRGQSFVSEYTARYWFMIYSLGWGLPLIVSLTLYTLHLKKYSIYLGMLTSSRDELCWLEPIVFYTTWLTPYIIQLIWNLIVFGQIISVLVQLNKQTTNTQTNKQKSKAVKIQNKMKSIFGLGVTLGISSIFSFFIIKSNDTSLSRVITGLYILCNGLQGQFVILKVSLTIILGFFLMIFHIFCSKKNK